MDDKATAAPTADAATETEKETELATEAGNNEISSVTAAAVVAATAAHTTVTVEPLPTTSKLPHQQNLKSDVLDTSSSGAIAVDASVDTERCCWICFATDEDNRLAAWVQPCQCRGTTKWVHQSCLYRWIDEKTQKGNALRSVSCPQCQTEYIIVFPQMGRLGGALEAMDNVVKRLSPFLAAGFFVGSLYWTAVTYGAVTFLQIVGHEHGMSIMEAGDPLILLIGLPAIPVGLILGRLIRWEDALLRLIRNRGTVMRKFPFVNFIYPNLNQEEEPPTSSNPATPALSDPVSATRIFCGALLLPTISCIVGRILFDSVENTLHRTLLGGLTFITVKGMLKIYLKQKQYARRKKRRIVDYTEENIRNFMHRSNNNSNAAAGGGGGATGLAAGARHHHHQQQQQQPVLPMSRLAAAAAAARERERDRERERERERELEVNGDSVV
ncbi:E3 ubiquitin-protein ligase MARCHF5 isoform X2 [Drosophila sulfurigaster albostrigata]|nr:E3 ubiquitin-protein ligase MARCHF5 isoform X2 [Drosophila sulfurigaster albostrigata]XP_062122149.1 E3 ubiquitin-protein ligase MARCHF5 isoform X2 [Drosophila sulfurigaster albostrigata]